MSSSATLILYKPKPHNFMTAVDMLKTLAARATLQDSAAKILMGTQSLARPNLVAVKSLIRVIRGVFERYTSDTVTAAQIIAMIHDEAGANVLCAALSQSSEARDEFLFAADELMSAAEEVARAQYSGFLDLLPGSHPTARELKICFHAWRAAADAAEAHRVASKRPSPYAHIISGQFPTDCDGFAK